MERKFCEQKFLLHYASLIKVEVDVVDLPITTIKEY